MANGGAVGGDGYAALKRGVNTALLKGMEEAEQAKVRTYWNAGKLICGHLLGHEDPASPRATTRQVGETLDRRAGYGRKLFARLGRDLGVGSRLLYHCARFAKRFPKLSARTKLGWAHYRVLAEVPDDRTMFKLEATAQAKEWTSRELEDRVRALNVGTGTGGAGDGDRGGQKLLTPKRGRVGVFQEGVFKGKRGVDLGFTTYVDPEGDGALALAATRGTRIKRRKAGSRALPATLVTLSNEGMAQAAKGATRGDLFTYLAEVIRVVDGDTIWFRVYLRPNHWLAEKIRLRGIDAPELNTKAGRAAKKFVVARVAEAERIVITTTKPDKWDRYLSDVFLERRGRGEGEGKGEAERRAPRGSLFLNNALIEAGLAEVKTEYRLPDWE